MGCQASERSSFKNYWREDSGLGGAVLYDQRRPYSITLPIIPRINLAETAGKLFSILLSCPWSI